MSDAAGLRGRLRFLADVVTREAQYLTQADQRLFGAGFGIAKTRRFGTRQFESRR